MMHRQILDSTDHRPWALPDGRWKYYQEWNDTVFLHWRVDQEVLRSWVPEELELDLFAGTAWVSLVAFDMERIRPRNLPPLAPISNFHEINIRTYVNYRGKSGVYFLSIEGGKKLSCTVARNLSGLPYRYSRMSRREGFYQSENDSIQDQFELRYRVGQEREEKDELDLWLTERYALFQDSAEAINQFEIHHVEWPVHVLEVQQLDVQYPRFSDLINGAPDRVHYSPGVQVLAWDKVGYPLKAGKVLESEPGSTQ